MKDPILLNNLWKEVEAGRVSVSSSDSLTIFKYTQDTHIKDEWNEVNRLARGIIFHADGTVMARPFPKFFNLGERPESSMPHLPKEPFECYEKMDGSCGIGYVHDGPQPGVERPVYADGKMAGYLPSWRLATPGSMESDQAIEGTKILHETMMVGDETGADWPSPKARYNLAALPQDCTPVFEIIYPENRIVVDYHGSRELVLLAILEHNGVEWHPRRVDQIAEMCGFRRPRLYDFKLDGDLPFEDNHEGFVVRFESGFRLKVKSPTYLRIHRLLNHLSPKGVIELVRGKEYGATVKQLPAAIAADFDDIRAYVQSMHNKLLADAYGRLRALNVTRGLATRKDQAAWIIDNVPNAETGFVFGLLDGKDIEDKIWTLVLHKVKDEGRAVATE